MEMNALLGTDQRTGRVIACIHVYCVRYMTCTVSSAQFLSLETPAQRVAYPRNLAIYRGGIIPPPLDYLPFKELG